MRVFWHNRRLEPADEAKDTLTEEVTRMMKMGGVRTGPSPSMPSPHTGLFS
jgi:hypothetical protein